MKALVLAAAFLVAGCGTVPGETVDKPGVQATGAFTEDDVRLNDGRVIHCLFWTYGLMGSTGFAAMDCDWTPR